MIDDQAACPKAITQEHKPFFVLGMIRVIDQARVLVQENSLCILEGDAMLDQVGLSLAPIPGKLYIAHNIILAI